MKRNISITSAFSHVMAMQHAMLASAQAVEQANAALRATNVLAITPQGDFANVIYEPCRGPRTAQWKQERKGRKP